MRSQLMGRVRIAGVNLAILYGLGLILAAVVLAMLYLILCRRGGGRAGEGEAGALEADR